MINKKEIYEQFINFKDDWFQRFIFSKEVWEDNYKFKQEKDYYDTAKRLAFSNASVEKEKNKKEWESKFFYAISNLLLCPGGRIIANLGTGEDRKHTTLFNCYIWSVQEAKMKNCDSIEGIYDALKIQAHTLKSEGGYGVNASWIRPSGTYVQGIGGRTPGVLKFMELWDKSSEIITMGSDKTIGDKKDEEKIKIRKGAQMLVLSIWHPDIEEFITAKQTPNRLTKFNMSVGITEGFMEAVVKDKKWDLVFPDTTYEKYSDEWFGDIEDWKLKGYPVIKHKTVKAKDLWNLIMKSTYNRNEPGVLFLDVVNKYNPINYVEKIFATNPCGEIPAGLSVCDLASLVLPFFVKINEKEKLYFDFDLFKSVVEIGIRFLDNVLDISTTPLEDYDIANKNKRRVGLGVMGLGSLHYMLGLKYGSKESIAFCKKLFKVKLEAELLTSAKLGEEKGSFLLFDAKKHFKTSYWNELDIDEDIKKEIEEIGCMRNSHTGMNAPTGNTAVVMMTTSGGIEPVFLEDYLRWSIVNQDEKDELKKMGFEFPNPHKSEWFETKDFKFTKRGDEEILKGTLNGTEYEIDKNRGLVKATIIKDFGWKFAEEFYSKDELKKMKKDNVFVTTKDLTIKEHIDVLKVCSKYTNQGISKTVNLPNNYPFESFKELYLNSWKSKIKGITTYREGTMTVVLESLEKQPSVSIESGVVKDSSKRPTSLEADIYTVTVKGEKFVVAIGLYPDGMWPYEIFCGHLNGLNFKFQQKRGKIIKVKSGHYKLEIGDDIDVENFSEQFTPTEKGLFRMVSASLRHRIPIKFIVEQLQKSEDDITSMSNAAARVLKKYINDGENVSGLICQSCKSTGELIYEEGCIKCLSCGWSKCS